MHKHILLRIIPTHPFFYSLWFEVIILFVVKDYPDLKLKIFKLLPMINFNNV